MVIDYFHFSVTGRTYLVGQVENVKFFPLINSTQPASSII